MIIIGIAGKKKSGKSLAANYIKAFAPSKVVIVSYADALKDEVAKACSVNRQYIEDHKDNFRLILQGWGTDYRRKLCGDDYWINKLITRLNEISNITPNAIVIIPDVRFRNEARNILMLNGFLINVTRLSNVDNDTHESENDLQDYPFDGTIVNDGTVEQFHDKIKQTLKKVTKLII